MPIDKISGHLFRDPKGNSFRILTGRGSMKVISRYPSIKARRAMPCESRHEEYLVYISEADSNVVDYLTQPHKLVLFPSDGKKRIYHPDMQRTMADGSIEIIETKRNKSEVDHRPEYRQKLEWAEMAYGWFGYNFKILTEVDDLDIRPLLPNAKMIALDNKTAWGTADQLRLQSAFQKAGSLDIPYGRAIEALAQGERDAIDAKAVLHAMIVRRLVGIDIYRRIDANSTVTFLAEVQ